MQVLVSTMYQNDCSLLDRMNIQTDAIVVNQCDRNEITEFEYKGHRIKWISLAERGVGLSRNTALMRATADIVLFADDDVVYADGYEKRIRDAYASNPKADLLTFDLESLNPNRKEKFDAKPHRLHWYNSLKYGAFRISVRRMSALKHNLVFSLLYGGGAVHQAGEDNLFMTEALHRGLYVKASGVRIGTVAQNESTWFHGYDERYFYDRGVLFANMYGCSAKLILTLFEIKDRGRATKLSFTERVRLEKAGIKDYRCKN